MTDIALRTRLEVPGQAVVAEAGGLLRRGSLVAFPTETVYGLGANARSGEAVARIFAAKQRPHFNPLIAHVATIEAALAEGVFGPEAKRLAEGFWPGPLTLVVPVRPDCSVSDLARAGLSTVALRVPAHHVAQAVLVAAAVPIAAPSANRSGRISPTTAQHVLGELDGRCDLILDGGATDVGLESTIVACLDGPPRLLRPGGVSREAIQKVLGASLDLGAGGGPAIAPGMLASHYAPGATVRLGANQAAAHEAVLDFGGALSAFAGPAYFDLSPGRRLDEAAANLFRGLRTLDAYGTGIIAVAPIPAHGLGEAINDRLRRAAAPRS